MKRFFIIGTVLLLGLSSCTDPQMLNPNFNPETNKVNTQFVLSIAAADEVNTKQLGQVAQLPGLPNSAFRGMVSASLFTFARGTDRDGLMILDSTEVAQNGQVKPGIGQDYVDLSTMILKSDLKLDQNGSDSRRILQISLPTGTNGLLFYGLAGNTYNTTALSLPRKDLNEYDEYGILDSDTPSLYDDLPMSQIGSHLVSRLGDATEREHLLQVEGMFSVILNKLMLVGLNGNKPWNSYSTADTVQFKSNTGTEGRIYSFGKGTDKKKLTWADYAMSAESNPNPKSPLPSKTTPVPRTGETLNPNLEASPLEKILGNAYLSIATFGVDSSINMTEIRAGAANAIMRQFQDLFSIFQAGVGSTVINTEEMIAQDMMIEILKHIAKFTDATIIVTDDGNVQSFTAPTTWEALTTVHNLICPTSGDKWDASLYDYAQAPPSDHPLRTFPQNFNLPQGSVVMKKVPTTATNENMFAYYVDDINVSDMGHNPGATMSIQQYTYPAPLCYYGNSPVRVNNASEVTENDYANGYANWANDTLWKSDWAISHVTSSTRGVAMMYNIQYGVALFKQQVKYSDAVKTSGFMYDNNDNMHKGEAAHEIPVNDNSFVWTGIMIGGQPNSVGWDYLTKSKDDAKFTMMIYDRAMGTPVTTGQGTTVYYNSIPFSGSTLSDPNYTVVYDNFSGSRLQTDQNVVYVALEFVNRTGKDFWGIGGIVRDEGTFYLIGELSPYTDASKTTPKAFTWPDEEKTKQIVPPFKEVEKNGKKVITGEKIVRVFVQDFMTDATFVLNQYSLKRAYVTVPDLKSSKVSLGLSVDLNWRGGLNFTDVQLGQINEPTTNTTNP